MAANASTSSSRSVVALNMGMIERERRVDVFLYYLFMGKITLQSILRWSASLRISALVRYSMRLTDTAPS